MHVRDAVAHWLTETLPEFDYTGSGNALGNEYVVLKHPSLEVLLYLYDTKVEVVRYITRKPAQELARHHYEYANPAFPQNLLNLLETIQWQLQGPASTT